MPTLRASEADERKTLSCKTGRRTPHLSRSALSGAPASDMRLVAKLLDGFADDTRMSIPAFVACRGETGLGGLAEAVKTPHPRVSGHLRCLGLVRLCAGRTRGTARLLRNSRRAGAHDTSPWPTAPQRQPGARRGVLLPRRMLSERAGRPKGVTSVVWTPPQGLKKLQGNFTKEVPDGNDGQSYRLQLS